MALLVEQLKATEKRLRVVGYPTNADWVKDAAAVCAAVEAFQAAEQALSAAAHASQLVTDQPYLQAREQFEAAEARLLEVNLG